MSRFIPSLRTARNLVIVSGLFGGLYFADKKLYASTFQRNARTLWTGLVVALDYKLNFAPGKADKINILHR